MPKHIEILQYDFTDDKAFVYTPPTGETIDSNKKKILTDYINKKLSGYSNKSDKSIRLN